MTPRGGPRPGSGRKLGYRKPTRGQSKTLYFTRPTDWPALLEIGSGNASEGLRRLIDDKQPRHCKDCTFWKPTAMNYTDRGKCDCPKFLLDYDTPALNPDEVWVESDEGWGFMTGPDFGCIHWQQNQKE